MATSGDGYVVVGADDGKVRLYSEKTLTQAKTSIPGMGLPITNVDVTFDGQCAVCVRGRGQGLAVRAWLECLISKEESGLEASIAVTAGAVRCRSSLCISLLPTATLPLSHHSAPLLHKQASGCWPPPRTT